MPHFGSTDARRLPHGRPADAGGEYVQVHTRHGPAFGVARLLLTAGESVRVTGGSMMASSFGVTVESSGKRSVETPGKRQPDGSGRRRAGTVVLTAPNSGGWADVAPDGGGDVYAVELTGDSGWCLARGCVLAATSGLRSDEHWPGFRAMFGSDTGFLEHWSGYGSAVLSAGGAVDMLTLDHGEVITVDPAHLLGYPDRVQTRLRAVDQSSPQSLRTGAGLAIDLAGPAYVLLQTRTR